MANRVSNNCCSAGSAERAGLPGLLRDLQRLSEDQDSADIVFILGTAEEKVYAHKIILFASTKGSLCNLKLSKVTTRRKVYAVPRRLDSVAFYNSGTINQFSYPRAFQRDHALFDFKDQILTTRTPSRVIIVAGGLTSISGLNKCKSFQNTKRGEVCRIPGCTITPSVGTQPTPIRMPHVQPETFRLFIQYVYTGKLLLHDSGVFEMMTLAADLGVEDLRAACEDHVTSTLSVESACTLLAAAMEIQDRPGGKSASSFMERCIAFVGDNAADCIKTNAFLNLPKEALIKLISSDFLSLEEEEVWRCALAWAKQRAGVTQPTAHWTEEERARVCHHLAPLMQHVRLLLIDSSVFAEEVEPTGAVPMELSLERYRRAALHAAPRPDPDKRTQPRLAVNMFSGSTILQQDKSAFQALINSWCGTPKQSWRLVFRASAHGFAAPAFHSHCDGVAPVLLLVQLSRGAVIGGFCSAAWAAGGAGGYVPAERGFLFSLGESPQRHPLVKKAFALCYHPDCGPVFGAGADLLLAHHCHANCDSYSNLHSYGDAAAPASLAHDYNFTVRDYELFTLDH